MSWILWLMAAGLGIVVTVSVRPLLRLVTAPDNQPAGTYSQWATSRFAMGCGCIAAAASLLVMGFLQPPSLWLPWLLLSTAGVVLVCVDAATGFLPTLPVRATWALMAIALIVMPLIGSGWSSVVRGVIGAVLAGLLFGALWLLSRGQMGFGDVRFVLLIGAAAAAASWPAFLGGLLGGSLIALVLGIVIRIRTGRQEFPYTPGLLIGAFVAVLVLT